jgi:hypothetical protein
MVRPGPEPGQCWQKRWQKRLPKTLFDFKVPKTAPHTNEEMMKQTALTIGSILGLLLAPVVATQGTAYVSNLGQTPTGSGTLGNPSIPFPR